MVQKIDSQEQEKARERNHLQLIDMIAQLREDVRKLPSILLKAPPSREQTLVSLPWLYDCADA